MANSLHQKCLTVFVRCTCTLIQKNRETSVILSHVCENSPCIAMQLLNWKIAFCFLLLCTPFNNNDPKNGGKLMCRRLYYHFPISTFSILTTPKSVVLEHFNLRTKFLCENRFRKVRQKHYKKREERYDDKQR